MRRMSCTVMVMSTLLAMVGCGGHKTIKTEDRAAIESVSVAPGVKVPNEPMVVGSEAGLAILFGPVGGAIAADAEKTSAKNFSEFLRVSGIDVGQIVREQFTETLKSHSFYGSRLSPDGSYRLVLEVRAYGINKTNTFSANWVPNLRIDYQLLSPDGKVLAEDWAMTAMFSARPTFTTEEMQANPQIVKQAFEKTASAVAAKLVKHME